jgi:hypothetical protein
MITRYVNTASTAGGNGTTNDTAGANRAYASLFAANAALNAAKVSDDLTIMCCGTAADTTAVSIGTLVTNLALYTVTIKGNPDHVAGKHRGYLSDSHYRIVTNVGSEKCLSLLGAGKKINVDGIQLVGTSTYNWCLMMYDLASCTISNCIGVTTYRGAEITGSVPVIFKNCVISSGSNVGILNSMGTFNVYNTLLRGFNRPISGGVIVKNCIAFGSSLEMTAGTIDYCATDHGSGSHPISVSSWADQFYNANYIADVDFRLKTTSVLINAGVGPALDANIPTTDIIAHERSGNTTTVGPFEYWNGYIPGAFPNDPYDGEEHRAILTKSLYVYDASRTRWGKSLYYSMGETGLKGITGAGTPGLQGATGVAGSTGVAGIVGIAGATGIGTQGETGSQGITGMSGLTGPQGDTGPDSGVTGCFNFVMNNPSTGIAGQVMLPYSLQIDSWEVVSSDVTKFRSELRTGPYSAWPPSYSMNGSVTGPHIGDDFKNASYDLSGWAGTTGAYGDWMTLHVEDSDSPESITVVLGYHQV